MRHAACLLTLCEILFGCAGRTKQDPSTPEDSDAASVSGSGIGTASSSSGAEGNTLGSTCTLSCPLAVEGEEPICDCARQTPECTADTDCVLATNLGACCFQQKSAYPASLPETEPCINNGRQVPQDCPTPDCSAATCDTPVMQRIIYAACDAGICVARTECPEDLVEENGVCVPRCVTDDDCVIASRVDGCCPNLNCTMAMNRDRMEQDECIVEAGDAVPEGCVPSADECLDVDCDSSGCFPPQVATCADGVCVAGP